ncbi:hypothetical protein P9597_10625 [Aneurinibacillus migulanus]|uniref:hypothetical protein n=1 Tax=Aneurinibacillus migulanus TaxID=47500 RepID=UPI002E21E97E|nr:hypothetical protein [Aneurinibacillus migulanus]
MKKDKYNFLWAAWLLLTLLYEVFIPLIGDVAAGDTKDWIQKKLDSILVPMPRAGYIPLFLLLLTGVTHLIMKSNDNKNLSAQVEKLQTDLETAAGRVDNYQDYLLMNPLERVVVTKENEKLNMIKDKMERFVPTHDKLLGIQIFSYNISATYFYAKRVIEEVDNISSWTGKEYSVDPIARDEFYAATYSIDKSKMIAFIKKYSSVISRIPKDNLSEKNVFQFACINVITELLHQLGHKEPIYLPAGYSTKLYSINKRIGILESILFLIATNHQRVYIFRKTTGDSQKNGRSYLAHHLYISGQAHVALFIFDRMPAHEVLRNAVNMEKTADMFLKTLANR